MLFLVFIVAAAITFFGGSFAPRFRKAGWPQPEGVCLVTSVLAVCLAALAFHYRDPGSQLRDGFISSPDQVTAMPIFDPKFTNGLVLVGLTACVYGLSALRGVLKLPAWVADVIVVVAALIAVNFERSALIQVSLSSRADAPQLALGVLTVPLSIFTIWVVSRLGASLNRVPMVSGGYLGIVSMCFLFLLSPDDAGGFFPSAATASLAGAGIASFLLAQKSRAFNLGWSATLAMGFMLGTAINIGLLKHSLLTLLALAVLAIGLPFLDVTFLTVRAKLRGQKVDWSESHLRLHEALLSRGVSPAKIGLLYFALGIWICSLAFLATRWLFLEFHGYLLAITGTLVLFALAVGGAFVFLSITRMLMRRRPDEVVPESLEAFGVRITPVSMDEALDRIEEFIRVGRETGKPHHIVTSDANAVLTSKRDEEYAGIIRRASLITPDGFGLIWGARLLNLPLYERVTGVDMVTGICERAAKRDYRIFILGSEPGVASTAATNLAEKYPGVNMVGTHHGMILRDEELMASVLQQVKDAKPDVLFVAMGIPLQEKFIAKHMQDLNVPVLLGVGGSFDVYAGKFNRAPQYIQRMGLEWLYRVWIDPSRWRRMGYVPQFMVVALRTWAFGPRPGTKAADAF